MSNMTTDTRKVNEASRQDQPTGIALTPVPSGFGGLFDFFFPLVFVSASVSLGIDHVLFVVGA